jgi:serine phosphatase RsbU (regulator of sigma subunit)
VLGVFPDTGYQQAECALEHGDRLIFYTDGITEARDPEGEEFGEDRLAEAAVRVRTTSAPEIKDALLDQVTAFCRARFEDDATLIVVALQ